MYVSTPRPGVSLYVSVDLSHVYVSVRPGVRVQGYTCVNMHHCVSVTCVDMLVPRWTVSDERVYFVLHV